MSEALLFDIDELDSIDGLKPKIEVREGNLFQLGRHRLLCGDCTIKDNISLLMDGKKADMIFTDPPYGINVVSSNGKIGSDVLAKCQVYKAVENDDTIETAKNFYELIKNTKKIILFGGNYFLSFLPYGYWLVWNKLNGKNNFADGEMAWTNIKTPLRIFNFLWNGMIRCEKDKRIHPTQKPVSMLSEILQTFSDENEIILDGFLGSGSTLIACEYTNRVCYGMEIEPYYCSVIIERWQKYTNKKAIKIN
ncbi:DNA methyltransferase [Brachyspira innocens]|uniref:DNA-methyltransferase n=1 Tax=Brachyspira innocens TaxID=13264 RepID=UPI0026F24FC1|nr:DNA methyltransferase [Brachyspira innocens]